MKLWKLIVTDAEGHGKGEVYQLRWQAELAYKAAQVPGVIVTLAEFVNGQQTEIVQDTRFSVVKEK